jgi:hypothetical protein
MRVEAKHIWISSLPFLAATLFLPVMREAWLDGQFDVSGLEAAFWIPTASLASLRAFIAVPKLSFLPDCLLTAVWGLFLLALVITPFLVFSRFRERQPAVFFTTTAVIVSILVGTWFSPLLWERHEVRPFHYSGYRLLACAIVLSVVALVVRSMRPNPH